VNQAGHVERNLRKQEISYYILQAHDQTEQDLGYEQSDGCNKV